MKRSEELAQQTEVLCRWVVRLTMFICISFLLLTVVMPSEPTETTQLIWVIALHVLLSLGLFTLLLFRDADRCGLAARTLRKIEAEAEARTANPSEPTVDKK